MLDQIHLLAAVTVLGVLEQAYFFLQVIYARRAFGISPPKTSGPPEFERIFRAQVNSSEYFPIFLALLWQAGLFFHQGLAAALGLLYLYGRYCYFMGYRASSSERYCSTLSQGWTQSSHCKVFTALQLIFLLGGRKEMQTRLVARDANGHVPTSLLVGTWKNCQRAVSVLPERRNLLREQPDELSTALHGQMASGSELTHAHLAQSQAKHTDT
ncbi:uncharacterized protein LOC141929534 isoform X1 [Strix aluco]|uniref:uncharacterized protein LOC141929534 isoform X1 n=1 Tax=Strix aluco TaxID=111821 RepID=UPI003DA63ED3